MRRWVILAAIVGVLHIADALPTDVNLRSDLTVREKRQTTDPCSVFNDKQQKVYYKCNRGARLKIRCGNGQMPVCVECNSDTYKAMGGPYECLACPPGYTSNPSAFKCRKSGRRRRDAEDDIDEIDLAEDNWFLAAGRHAIARRHKRLADQKNAFSRKAQKQYYKKYADRLIPRRHKRLADPKNAFSRKAQKRYYRNNRHPLIRCKRGQTVTCSPCALNYYKPTKSAKLCVLCPPELTAEMNITGAKYCDALCSKGWWWERAQGNCKRCSKETFKGTVGPGPCQACPAGSNPIMPDNLKISGPQECSTVTVTTTTATTTTTAATTTEPAGPLTTATTTTTTASTTTEPAGPYAACTWPAEFANSEWIDSSMDTLTFADSTMIGWNFTAIFSDTATNVASWECYSTELYDTDSFLTMKTTVTFQVFDINFYGYLCLKLKQITTSSYRYYLYNPVQPNIDHQRILMVRDSVTNVPMTVVCDEYVAATGTEYHVLIQSGSGNAVKVPCPYVFLGLYTYTHTAVTGDGTCGTTATRWGSCTDTTEMVFNYPACQTMVAYSESPTVWCVDNVPIGGDNFVTVYNPTDATVDNSNTYRFSCFGISGDGTTASVTPQHCKGNQSPAALPVDNSGTPIGATLTMTAVETCPTCPSLSSPDGGSVYVETDGAVTTAYYTCASEYAGSRTCQSDNTWTLTIPDCSKFMSCIAPTSPANGEVSVDDTGDVATYRCLAGYILNGNELRNCQIDGNAWDGADPTCDVCDALTAPAGGDVNLTQSGPTTVATYTCHLGHSLGGVDTRTCIAGGAWDGDTPTCGAVSP